MPFIFLLTGRWSPKKARKDEEEHEAHGRARARRAAPARAGLTSPPTVAPCRTFRQGATVVSRAGFVLGRTPMASADVLVDCFERVHEVVHHTVDGLTPDQLATRVDGTSNSIAWLVWHLTRVQDDHIADAAGIDQVWTTKGWYDRFGLPFEPGELGYGMDPEQTSEGHGHGRAAHRLLRRGPSADAGLRAPAARLGADPHRRRSVGSAGSARRAAGERHLRLPAACRASGFCPRPRHLTRNPFHILLSDASTCRWMASRCVFGPVSVPWE